MKSPVWDEIMAIPASAQDGQSEEHPLHLPPTLKADEIRNWLSWIYLKPADPPMPSETLYEAILKVSSLFIDNDGRDYAIKKLEALPLSAARRLELCRTHHVVCWIEEAVKELMQGVADVDLLSRQVEQQLGEVLFSILARRCARLNSLRKRVAAFPPGFEEPPSADCDYGHHLNTCKPAWGTAWTRYVAPRINHPTQPWTFSRILDDLRHPPTPSPYRDIHPGCLAVFVETFERVQTKDKEIVNETVQDIIQYITA